MDLDQDQEYVENVTYAPKKRSFWSKLGGGALSISILVHVGLLVLGAFWVFQIIQEPPKKVDFMPAGGGGGSPESTMQQKQRTSLVQKNVARVSAIGVSSDLSLPEPELGSEMSSLSNIGGGGMSGGLGGNGSGGGKGNGRGSGFGDGMGPGMGDGTGIKNPFGAIEATPSALVGTFYDLKQTSDRQPTNMTDDEMRLKVRDIVDKGFKEKEFRDYYKASQKLYQNKLHMPFMSAEAAPAAFNCEKEVQPRRWIVVYRGTVKAPKTGKFRFVGAGDDLLVVRFNNRTVFDYGYTLGCTGTHMFGRAADVDGTNDVPELAKDIRKMGPMRVPIQFYKYETSPNYNDNIGGFAVGPEFSVKEGNAYPVEILIGEIPGGYFGVSLLIEEIGENYEKATTGAPILPLFRLDNSLPDPNMEGPAPRYAKEGPIWKQSGTSGMVPGI
ncbi:hypothetical protein [Luteolibacter luteus]|uniref:PA14 domain-containing protein n=1 Tax=Luteolibacter luteus TaxID=2728835 RepID=A0A858RKV7_9BACT|nr:hypothetical protein [Luteolibacter luteus]QJE97375.1 hypothetical protein HHL09_16805 [Luteolibacter luteus]